MRKAYLEVVSIRGARRDLVVSLMMLTNIKRVDWI
jgi:hypothetical protein